MTQILLKVMEDKGNWPPGEQSTWDRGLIGSNPNGLVALEAVILSLGSQWSHLEGDSSKNSDVQTISQTHWIRSLGIGPRHQCFISISRELPLSLLRSDWINILSLPSVSNIKKKKTKNPSPWVAHDATLCSVKQCWFCPQWGPWPPPTALLGLMDIVTPPS